MTQYEHVIPSLGEPQVEACLRCKEPTLIVVQIYAITSEAAHRIGGYAICAECGWTPYAEKPGSSG
jgi:hypothetical protein